ncbi:glyoxalase [Mucilaginibacter rubeus]|uniref:Glyoxalase n=1 Tax=Mucilaginibacter rubeus TaxID=2027860 RepID=A0AAE6MIV4_9SPHI|nr:MULTISPECIES: VOC family protein [Mucilaginibacter]QEM05195.1 glyoxalase [Mucilaginibacter rubeus]QEM17789.1 glyoxalase [Mucilaginibacter gossypii]QTE45685.1 VOC family protein [Mucilaginibacter rubeus]QTE52282.1 VOC family protein [Mucilaginibacter rubeus]QTE57369.1 VOC family protein [Mucilaginibacter rubeus]
MKAIEIISIPVTDQQAAKAFYLKIGFEILVEANFEKQTWIQMAFPGSPASITLVNWFAEMPAGSVRGLVIKTDDLDKDIADLKAKGLEVGNVDTTPWGRFATVKDPDGNALSLHAK